MSALIRVLTVVLLAPLVSCTVLFFTTSSEENLLCGPEDGPRCLEGFACVRAEDGQDRCVRAGFKEPGDACLADAECADGAVCADAYADLCPDGADDPNCARVTDAGLRCRAACDEAQGFACEGDDRCFFFDGVTPFCQAGTCATDTDCGNGQDAFCVGERGDGGRNGFCDVSCDPLACFDGVNCPCLQGEACATPADELFVSTRNVCDGAGELVAPQVCDVVNPCADGFTCAPRNDGLSVCVQWCRVGGGAPACGQGTICQNVANGAALGICQ